MASKPTKLRTLKSTHPRLDPFYVRVLRALYKGGYALLHDDEVMKYVFPRHAAERPASYNERRARAAYDNDFALVINKITATLAQDPVTFDNASGPTGTSPEAKPLDEYWAGIMRDSTPPGDDGLRKTFDEVIRECITEGLVAGWGWVMCDLPPALEPVDGLTPSLAEQDEVGGRRAYPVPVSASQVLNWQEKNGKLSWLRMYSSEMPADNPEDDRDWVHHTWKVWDALHITTYKLVLDRNGKDPQGREWKPDDVVPVAEVAPHTFGRVPWVRFDCSAPDEAQLHVGDLIESRCRSLFNESNGETFQRLRHMFQQLYEFLGTEMPGPDHEISENQEDPNRAGRNLASRAPDIVQVRGHEDDARFVSPDMSGAAINRQALSEGREAIPRVTGQLALASDTSGAMIKRSGESKAQDKIAEEVVAGAIGKRGLAFANAVADMLAIGRGDDPKNRPPLRGYEHFNVDDSMERVEQHVALGTAPIKSATFQVEHQLMVALAILGDGVTPEMKALIRDELESTITQDSINQANMPSVPPGHQLDEDGMPIPLPPQKPEPAKPPAKGGKK